MISEGNIPKSLALQDAELLEVNSYSCTAACLTGWVQLPHVESQVFRYICHENLA